MFCAGLLFIITFGCARDAKPVREKEISAKEKMLDFIISISEYSRNLKPGFVIIPQNGSILAFKDGKPKNGRHSRYLKAIDAFGIEGLFYNGTFQPDTTRINNLKKLQAIKPILVSEFVENDGNVSDAKQKNKSNRFLSFIRTAKNYNYELIPENPSNENSNDISRMSQVKNYLYLINPARYESKLGFINAVNKTNYDLIIIDLFFNNNEPFSASEIKSMQQKANGGRRLVISYMNIGAAENWRYYWRKEWQMGTPAFLYKQYDGYDNEFWVNYWDKGWQSIIFGNPNSYTNRIINAGFDGVYLDNVEAYHYLYN